MKKCVFSTAEALEALQLSGALGTYEANALIFRDQQCDQEHMLEICKLAHVSMLDGIIAFLLQPALIFE